MQVDDAFMAGSDEQRCKHGEIAEWCGESECLAARKGLPVRVWRTPHGQAYHRKPTCEALVAGQRLAVQYGREASAPEKVPLSVACQRAWQSASTVSRNTFRLTPSHARSWLEVSGSTASCWSGGAVPITGGKAS